ncbi:MAG: Lrp/AsnC family transcriptional regulator [Methanomicrobiales archaeon HGW-Methanomicrobiales-3]|jgi:DNA-binding Lrp family transcriptional regulator|nr:MAG: Lrp/AsnC family transcriptional regulator [Methanomicrobiales archaeon HGW-Methanomicrobiales-3]
MDPTDILLLRELERGLPLVPAPFMEIGKRLDLLEDEVLQRIRKLKEAGIIRKFRARIDQRKVGVVANALVAWKPVGTGHGDTGALLAAFPSVTHCYEREPVPGRWEYTHYTVHHGYSRESVEGEVDKIARSIHCHDYVVLFSTREFKRVPNVRMGENGGGCE